MFNSRLMAVTLEHPPTERLSDALLRLLAASKGEAMPIRQMVDILQGRGLQMVVILLCLPFLTPVTLPGISIPFGLAIAFSGLRTAFGHKPWLPGFILNRRVSYSVLERMVNMGCKIYGRLERLIRPRLSILLEGRGMDLAIGLTIASAGFFLSLPIPPPFPLTNTIPGFAIILLSLGIMERDGLLVAFGFGLTLVAAVYVALIAFLGQAGVMHLWKFISAL